MAHYYGLLLELAGCVQKRRKILKLLCEVIRVVIPCCIAPFDVGLFLHQSLNSLQRTRGASVDVISCLERPTLHPPKVQDGRRHEDHPQHFAQSSRDTLRGRDSFPYEQSRSSPERQHRSLMVPANARTVWITSMLFSPRV